MKLEKQYARRDITGFVSPYPDPFRYQALADVGEDAFIDALGETLQDSLSRDLGSNSAPEEFRSLKEFAGSAFDPRYWEIAYLSGNVAGIVCAQRYFDKPEEGSLFHLGLVNEVRGRGLGKVIHAHGLELLGRQGLISYVGSTDVLNKAMINVLKKNGCRLTRVIEVSS